MTVAETAKVVASTVIKLLLSGKKYHIFIDIDRSQVRCFKYIDKKDYKNVKI